MLPPQERVVVSQPVRHTTRLSFMDKIFGLTPTERNR